MRRSYSSNRMYQSAQTGAHWILRGTLHLLFYKIVFHLKDQIPAHPDSFAGLLKLMTYGYLLYTRVSGQFHIAVGMLCLFGYRLPETHRRYLLAHSIENLWRRINIYWKDFMWKMVYLPAYFALRKSGDLRARVLATALVLLRLDLGAACLSVFLAGRNYSADMDRHDLLGPGGNRGYRRSIAFFNRERQTPSS